MTRSVLLAGIILLLHSAGVAALPIVEIPAGPFIMGDDRSEATPKHTVELETFSIHLYEVTNGDFATVFPDHTYPPGGDSHPATNLTRDQAEAYCNYLGQRLPTQAEWEKAARGRNGRIYPWGNKLPRRKPHPFFSGVLKRRVGFNRDDISPYGVRDMAGSVWEWTADTIDGKAVTRGGLWNHHLDFEYSKTFERNLIASDQRFVFLGFRCAR